MKLHIIDEAERCLKCKKPLCQQGCPIHTPIPQITQLLLENRLMKAGEILFANNPMSAVCSTVCNHENQCEGHCVLGRKSSPIHFSSIENFISDSYLDRMEVLKIEEIISNQDGFQQQEKITQVSMLIHNIFKLI